MAGPLTHAALSLAVFLALAWPLGPIGAGLVPIAWYWGREGAEAQRATRLPKEDTRFLPFMPWDWPAQMQADLAGPVAAVILANAAWRLVPLL